MTEVRFLAGVPLIVRLMVRRRLPNPLIGVRFPSSQPRSYLIWVLSFPVTKRKRVRVPL